MKKFIEYFKDEASLLLHNRKNLTKVLFLVMLILALPIGLQILQQQQIFKSRAAVDPIVFKGDNVALRNGEWVALKPQCSLEIIAPFSPSSNVSSPVPSSSP